MKIERSGNANSECTLTKKELYKLTMGNSTSLQDVPGQVFSIDHWCIYHDIQKKTMEEKRILAILTTDGDVISSISPTAISSFEDIVTLYWDPEAPEALPDIVAQEGVTSAGRKFVNLAVA